MCGESYAGKYIPRFSYEILDTNAKASAPTTPPKFNLQASLVGDPYTAPLTQRTNMYRVPEALNILDDSNMGQIATLNRRCQESLATDLEGAADICSNIMGYIEDISGGVFPYDMRIFGYDWDPTEDIVTDYLVNSAATADIYTALHVTANDKDPKFCMSCGPVGDAFVMDNLLDYSYYFELLIQQKSPVLIYAGEMDAQDGPK